MCGLELIVGLALVWWICSWFATEKKADEKELNEIVAYCASLTKEERFRFRYTIAVYLLNNNQKMSRAQCQRANRLLQLTKE